MMLSMKGLVLHETQAGDKGRFIDMLTEELGVVTVFVRGSKKITGKSIAATQLFSYADFCIEQRKDRYYYQNAKPIRIFYHLRENLRDLSLASYFAELIRITVPKDNQDNIILRLILNTLFYLTEGKRDAKMLKPLFELRFASEMGFMPDILMCKECMNYLPERLVFSASEGCFWCRSCYDKLNKNEGSDVYNDYYMSLAGLEMIRHITLVDLDRLFNFRAGDEVIDIVSRFSEAFICSHMSVKPRSLEFYHNIERNIK